MRSENYSWVMLGLAWLIIFTSWSFIFSTPTIINDIIHDLRLTHGEAGLILSAPVSMFVVFSILGGVLADRFGVKKAIGIATIFMGLFGFLRPFAPDFPSLFGFSVLLSAGIALAVPSVPKLVATWFPAERIGTATGVYLSGNGIGGWVAMGLTVSIILPLAGDWRSVLLVYGILGLVVSACWWGLARPAPPSRLRRETVPIKDALSSVIRNGDLWVVAGILFCINAIGFGILEWLPFVLEQRGIETATAALATSVFFLMFPMALVFPALSDRVKLRKPFIWIPGLIFIPATYLLMTAADLFTVLVLMAVCGV
ncbi:MAG: CynX/NimT family MFS transporter, partial [Candidatus Bathyarchaeia archaeon]